MRKGIFVLALIPAALALHGCGGGSAGGDNSQLYAENMVVDAGLNTSVANNNGVTFSVSGTAYNENRVIRSMNWVLKNPPPDSRTTVKFGTPSCTFPEGSTPTTGTNNWKDVQSCVSTVTVGTAPDNEVLTFMLTAVDSGGHSVSDDVSVTMKASAQALTADAGTDLNVPAGSEVKTACSYKGGVWFNPEVKNPTFRWYIENGDEIKLNGNSFSISWDSKTGELTARAPENVNKPFAVDLACEVTDDAGNTATDTTIYTVQSTPPLIAIAGVPQSVQANVTVKLDGTETYDPENLGLPIYYQWSQLSGEKVMISNPNNKVSTFVSPELDKTENLVFQLAVSRDPINEDTVFATTELAQTSVSVLSASDVGALMVATNGAQSVETATTVNLIATVTDPTNGNGDVYYQWKQVSGTSVVLSNVNTANASFVSPDVSADLVFEVYVSRAPITVDTVFKPTEKATASVTVRPPQAAPMP